MEGFILKIVTPDGCAFNGEVKSLVVRTTEGEVGILRNHSNFVSTIAYGMVRITMPDGSVRAGACMNGFVSVSNNEVSVVATTMEYADEIDAARAARAKEKAERMLAEKKSGEDLLLAEMKLKRALNRLNVYQNYR